MPMRPVLPPRVLAQPIPALELQGYTQRVTGPKSAAEPYREVIQAAVARFVTHNYPPVPVSIVKGEVIIPIVYQGREVGG